MRISIGQFGHYRLVVVGGGCSGLGASHKFSRILPKGQVAVVEPNEIHYYQPGFTLVGGGLMSLEANTRREKDLIHPNSVWIKKRVQTFKPKQNTVVLSDGEEVTYDYLLIASGMEVRLDLIKGLQKALDTPGVCSNYLPKYAVKTFDELKKFKEGDLLFTFPSTPLKCPGAPQKAAYLSEDLLRKLGKREKAHLHYYTTLPRIFGIEKYAKQLMTVIEQRGINLHTRRNLVEIDSDRKIAKFEILDSDGKASGEFVEVEYSFLHVGPPFSPISPLRECKELTDAAGWVDVNPKTLQSKHFPNVFAAGDCANSPNSKTAAAISSQLKAIEVNLKEVMDGREPSAHYDGYASCPLTVGSSKAILAEFNGNGPLETLPIDQSIPSYYAFLMKRFILPFMYWNGLIKGFWNGPATIRRILHFGLKK